MTVTVTPADEATLMFDCKIANCTGQTKLNRGPYAYLCDLHRAAKVDHDRRAGAGHATPKRTTAGGHVQQLDEIRKLASVADRKRATAVAATERAIEAKDEADRAEQAYRQALREATA